MAEYKVNLICKSSPEKTSIALRHEIGMHLFRLRQKRHYSAASVCQALKIKPRKFDDIELGRCRISWQLVGRILEYYRTEMFLGFTDIPKC